uniref:IQCH-like ATP-grasp domain-containing protein n=1 Tax=Sinocyclocheilus anshuiensis TaxID=1608454 RepID=A0A671SLM4_9TELE
MADVLKNKDEVGHILVQVQDDLRQLKNNLVRLTVQENGEVLDIQALDAAISRTEHGIRVTLYKSAFIMRLLNNPFHPKNKEIVQQNYGIQLPHLHKRTGASVSSAVSKYPFTIAEGQIDPEDPDYCRFKKQYCLYWGAMVEALDQLERMLLDFAVPLARVCGERLAACVQSGELDWRDGRGRRAHVEKLLSVLENRDEVWDLMCQPGQRYKGIEGHQAAAVCIQTCWRRYSARTAYLLQLRPKWAAQVIAISLLKHAKLGYLKKSLQASRIRQLENYHIRAESLAANWKHITSAKRTIIHVPSLGYSQHQRLSLRGFDVLQNTQMGRLCDIRDENVEVIYVSPVCLGKDVLQYYTRLLGLQTAIELGDASAPESHCSKRFTILMPEALEYFPTRNMCLASLLKYSPRTLQRIKNLIQGKQAYMISGVTHIDDLAVADELEVPLLGTEPAVTQLYSTKSGGRRIFSSAGVDMPPGKWDIYTLEQLHEGLARLMTEHMEVQRWLFKIDSEVGGRGTAYCAACHLKCRPWAQQEFSRYGPEQWRTSQSQESVMIKFLEEVPHLLASYAHPANTSCYATWTCFLEHFLREGGVIEAFPPSDSVTCLTVDLLVEPGGDVRMLSCGDQLRGPSGLEVVGCTVPQTSICPDVLHSICTRVGQACQQRSIMGHISLDLVTFLDPSNLEQQVWAIDLDLGYSNQLAMTQLMLMMTRGTLDCRTSKLEVPPPVRDVKSSARQGTVFALHDSRDRRSLGMLTILEDLQGALLTFARNLSIIHQEISAPNMQGTNNFKDLIKDIEEVLGMTIQNQTTSQEEEITAAESEQLSSHKPHRSTLN